MTIEVDFDYLAVFKQRLLGMCNTTYQWGPWNASNFVVSNIDVKPGDSAGDNFMEVARVTEQVESALASWRQDCERALGENGWERMGAIITSYETTEANNVRSFEGKNWPGGITDQQLTSAATDVAEYVTSPLNDEVQPKKDFADWLNTLGYVGSWISPSAWINSTINWVYEQLVGQTGLDVFNEISKSLSGDWEKVSKAGVALSALGSYYYNLGDRLVNSAWSVVPEGWLGDAAFNARDCYTTTGNAIMGLKQILDDAGDQYIVIADGMYSYGFSVAGMLQTIVDLLIVAAASAAAGVTFSWTGVGALLGGGAAATALVAAAATVYAVIDTLGNATTQASAAITVILGLVGASGVPEHKIPQP